MTDIYDNSAGRCDAIALLAGEDIQCSLAREHDGWAHQNIERELLWGGPTSSDHGDGRG